MSNINVFIFCIGCGTIKNVPYPQNYGTIKLKTILQFWGYGTDKKAL